MQPRLDEEETAEPIRIPRPLPAVLLAESLGRTFDDLLGEGGPARTVPRTSSSSSSLRRRWPRILSLVAIPEPMPHR